jgi:hypothetical protein
MRRGSKQHEEELTKTVVLLEKEGWRVIDLNGMSPDAIAIKNGKVVAVEVLGKDWRNHPKTIRRELHGSWTYAGKKKQYAMFDDVKIVTFIREGEGFDDEKLTKSILSILQKCPDKKTVDVWAKIPYAVSQRRVSSMLQELELKGSLKSDLQSLGRAGRFKTWRLAR